MKKIFSTLLALLLGAAPAAAEKITESRAYELARSFFADAQGTKSLSPARKGDAALRLRKATDGYYAFSRGTASGYVIVAADTRAAAEVLGYADAGTFVPDSLPAALSAWLDEYDRQMAHAATLSDRVRRAAPEKKAPIAPLVASRWDQGDPYNGLCPQQNGQRCVTGCVATAVAQIMYTHKWPERGTGSHSYDWTIGGVSQGTLSADFSQSVYDWAAMTDRYGASSSAASKTAVARLMADVGIACEMGYTAVESGAQTYRAGLALVEHFGYDKSLVRYMRNYYSAEEWQDMIYDNLKASRPVYYDGGAAAGGAHAFVCDGYNDGYFHMNWGWGGSSDGYFLLSALDPYEQGIGGNGVGFNYAQGVIANIRKDAGTADFEKFMYCSDDFDTDTPQASSTQNAGFTGWFGNQSFAAIDMMLGIKVVSAQGRVTYISTGWSAQLPSQYGYTRFEVPLSSFPRSAGTYRVYPAWYNNATGRWAEMRTSIASAKRFLVATVSGGTIAFASPASDVALEAAAPAVEGKIFAGKALAATTVFTATGGEYLNDVYLAVFRPGSSDALTLSSGVMLNLSEGESRELRFTVPAPENAGDYELAAVDAEGRIVSPRAAVKAVRLPAGSLALRLARKPSMENSDRVVADDMHLTADINCTGGFYNDRVYAYIFPREGGTSLGSLSASLLIGSGERRTVSFSGGFDGAEVGRTYMMQLYYLVDGYLEPLPALGDNNRIYFTVGALTPVGGVEAAAGAAETAVYTTAGRKIAVCAGTEPDLSSLPAGVYILKSGSRSRRVVKR